MKGKLTKSSDNVVLTGTLAGVAEYLNIDPTIVRVIYVFLSLTFIGAPIILYIALAIFIPASPVGKSTNKRGHNNKYYQNNNYRGKEANNRPRKEAEKVEEEDWSDF